MKWEGGLGSLKSLTMERLKVTLTMLIVNSKKIVQLVEQLPPELGAAEPACGSERSISVGVLSDRVDVHVFERTKDGSPRQTPFKVKARWHEVNGESSLFVFGRAAETPLGLLGDRQKRKAGVITQELFRSGP